MAVADIKLYTCCCAETNCNLRIQSFGDISKTKDEVCELSFNAYLYLVKREHIYYIGAEWLSKIIKNDEIVSFINNRVDDLISFYTFLLRLYAYFFIKRIPVAIDYCIEYEEQERFKKEQPIAWALLNGYYEQYVENRFPQELSNTYMYFKTDNYIDKRDLPFLVKLRLLFQGEVYGEGIIMYELIRKDGRIFTNCANAEPSSQTYQWFGSDTEIKHKF